MEGDNTNQIKVIYILGFDAGQVKVDKIQFNSYIILGTHIACCPAIILKYPICWK